MSGKYIDSTGVTYLWGKVKERVQANPSDTGTENLTKLKVGTTTYNIPRGSNIEIDAELSETSENPVQNKSVTTAITSLRERKYDQSNFQLRDGDYTSYQKDLSRIYRTEFNENGTKTNVSYRIPVVKAGGSMGAGWKPFEGINLDGQNYVFWLNNYKFGTNEEYKHTSSNFDYAEIQDLMYNGFRYRTQTIIDLDKLGFSSGNTTLTDEIITMIKNGSNIVIIHDGLIYRDYTEDTNYYNFTCIDYKNNENDYWVIYTLQIGKNDKRLLRFNGDRHYFVTANSSTAAYHYLSKLKVGKTNYMIPDVEANPTGTGTEALTSIYINGTVYNIPSGGGSGSDVSVFDLTPYFGGGMESIGTEGYNALKDYITNNNCPMVRLNLDGQMYCFNVSVYDENALLCSLVNVDGTDITALQLHIDNSGTVTISQAQNRSVEGIVEQGTLNLKGLKIGSMVYNITTLETYNLAINNNTGNPVPLKILTCETTTDGRSYLRVQEGNYGVGHHDISFAVGVVYKLKPSNHNGYIDLFTTKDGTFAILTANAEYSVDSNSGSVAGSLTLPTTSPSSQLIPSITTSNTQQNLTVGNGLTIENGVLKATGGGGGGVNTLELNNTDATAVGNAIDKLYKSDNDTTEIPLTTPVDFSKTYQYISYIWNGVEVIQTIGRYMNMLGAKLYMSMDKLSYFSTFEADNKSLGLTLVVTEENGVSTGKIVVARTATM